MKKGWQQIMLYLIVLTSYGCLSDEDKCIRQLVQETGICLPNASDSCFLIIIPGNGCGSCIQKAMDHIREATDTIYVFMCDTEKDFFLLSGGKKSTDFNNLYLDKDKVSARLKMVTTFPMVYFLKDGKYVERWPYQRPSAESRKRMSTLTADKQYIDWGSFRQAEIQEEKVILTNIGTDTLYISAIESSCECTTVQWVDSPVTPGECTTLTIHFRAEEKGEFERFIHVHCNVPESPIEISVKGKVQ